MLVANVVHVVVVKLLRKSSREGHGAAVLAARKIFDQEPSKELLCPTPCVFRDAGN
jgi:UTP-glucose-1-phosphate uridylyltransferase